MRHAILLDVLLSNVETRTHLTESNITKLTMPDTLLQRAFLSTSVNHSKVFICLELRSITFKYVVMSKTFKLLALYIAGKHISIIRQVYDIMKCDSRKRDFYKLIMMDMEDLDIALNLKRKLDTIQNKH